MSRKLVAYFSATGVTKKLAERVSKIVGADLHEIVPKEIYIEEDLNWMNENSRSSIEMKNKSFRPEIANNVDNMADYDTIYVGFPIWWYVAPTIINTFLESYDLKGKTIIPFATSGQSLMGNTNEELKNSCKNSILKEGRRFDIKDSDEVIKNWIENL
ncbi:flavodoxin [Parvimonas sp. D2]|uniref:flavodoxin n=1 Tax=unclassified Parvimonas TaxID=1151464 RepID=UPI002B45D1DA|nr:MULTISPECIES: flavodoxin [unclassified Parvimonas]MEB3011704.1 flavodoxin [Parvimonas sp. D2]MEB3087196.1 flavodoxin [Parvimonas sp. D4]